MAALNPSVTGQHLLQKRDIMLDKFRSITFRGKSFYLDLSHSKQTHLLTKAIYKMGGIIEGFLSKDVDYVVTGSRKASGIVNGQLRGTGEGQRRTAEKTKSPPCSRGKQLLKKVVQNQECSSLLTSAQSWGVCILHVDEVLDCLGLLPHRSKQNAEGERSDFKRLTLKIGKLKTPFLKIEDQSRKYRPLQCSFSSFPELSFISSDRSPFENTCTNNSTLKERDPGEQENDEVEKSKRPNVWEKSGYCECCQVPYTKLSEHLISEQHSSFALDTSNYRVIDNIASHIICDLLEFPYECKPAEECSSDVLCSIKVSLLSGAEHCLEEEQKLDMTKNEFVERFSSHPLRCLAEGATVEDRVASPAEEPKVEFQETLPVENNVGPWCAEDIGNTQPANYDETRHVTEVSWYTDETRLTSVYTVQSLVTPQVHLLNKHRELDTQGLLHPPQLLNTLIDPFSAMLTNGFGESYEPTQGEAISDVHTVPQRTNSAVSCEELLVDEPAAEAGGLYNKLFSGSSNEKVEHLLTTARQLTLENTADGGLSMISVIDSTVELHHQLLLAREQNKPTLSPDQLKLASPYPAASPDKDVMALSSASLTNFSDQGGQDQQLANTDCFKGKRKHCWSPCHPPAKKQLFQCQPVWLLHQFSSTGQWPAVPVFADSIGKNNNDMVTEGTTSLATSCFNPLLAQYNVLSDSDWDSQLLSQQQNIPQQSTHYRDLRTTQVNVDKSRYANQLYSVLAHDQSLGSPTTQTVTLTHTSYDLYLHEVAS